MKKLVWVTDPHLPFASPHRLEEFLANLEQAGGDMLVISGDIARSDQVVEYLEMLDRRLTCPIYFVLGNHDYYRSSIEAVREMIATWSRSSTRTRWLTDIGVVELSSTVGLLGHGGWGDARTADFLRSTIILNDYVVIKDLVLGSKAALRDKLQALGDEAAAWVRDHLPPALERFEKLFFVTHVPPFLEACWHQGRISDDDWSPHFTCVAVGEALREIMAGSPDRQLTVLCGHTHGAGEAQILPNLTVLTGDAEYGSPAVQRILTIE